MMMSAPLALYVGGDVVPDFCHPSTCIAPCTACLRRISRTVLNSCMGTVRHHTLAALVGSKYLPKPITLPNQALPLTQQKQDAVDEIR